MRKSTKIWLIIASSLVVIGCAIFGGVMTMIKWDFTKLSTVKYETNDYKINENYENISIVTDTADIVFEYSKDAKTSVVCYEENKIKHSVAVSDNTLIIEVEDARKWYEHIGIHFGTPKITVSIPQGEYGTLSVKTSTGNIRVGNVSADTLDFSVSTGNVTVSDVICKGNIKIKVSTGKTSIMGAKCQNFMTNGSTGKVSLKNVIATEKFSIERSTGDIKFDGCDAANIFIKTNTGDVKGKLLTDKVVVAQTDTGSVDVPKTVNGGRCEISTNTGDIKIEIK